MCPHPVRDGFSCLDENFVDTDEYEGAPVVLKSFRSDVAAQRIEYLKVVYEAMKNANVPNVDSLVHCGKYYVLLSPVGAGGFPFCRFPTNEQTVLEAIESILEALVILHSVGWMHRDIRWPNVIKQANQSKWFLIDFDHAATSPQDNSKDERLSSEEHAPDMFGGSGVHTTAVDIWGIGHLMRSCDCELDPDLIDYCRALCHSDPSKRPTADKALRWIQEYRSHTHPDSIDQTANCCSKTTETCVLMASG
ncbi:hypothetical protein AeRB84_007236 [Aphanomyces euteiches]|nr:hypothetical protein AeRB84_007236 [Aphanomyces euteiches]